MLSKAISSVLEQDYQYIEIIVVDDNGRGSDNQRKSKSIIDEFNIAQNKIKYISRLKNENGSAARNVGISKASGEYITLLDDDDYFLPDKISLQVKEMNTSPAELKVCCTWFQKISIDGRSKNITRDLLDDMPSAILLNKIMFPSSSLMFTRNVWEKTGGFDDSFLRQQDTEFLTRACSISQILLVKKDLYAQDFNK